MQTFKEFLIENIETNRLVQKAVDDLMVSFEKTLEDKIFKDKNFIDIMTAYEEEKINNRVTVSNDNWKIVRFYKIPFENEIYYLNQIFDKYFYYNNKSHIPTIEFEKYVDQNRSQYFPDLLYVYYFVGFQNKGDYAPEQGFSPTKIRATMSLDVLYEAFKTGEFDDSIRGTLYHEVQHFLDDYRKSEPMLKMMKQDSEKTKDMDDTAKFINYRLSAHEINASYTDAVLIIIKKIKDNKLNIKDKNAIINEFIKFFLKDSEESDYNMSFDTFPKNIQQRLLKRAYNDIYNSIDKGARK